LGVFISGMRLFAKTAKLMIKKIGMSKSFFKV
jgi:hypothetical protein